MKGQLLFLGLAAALLVGCHQSSPPPREPTDAMSRPGVPPRAPAAPTGRQYGIARDVQQPDTWGQNPWDLAPGKRPDTGPAAPPPDGAGAAPGPAAVPGGGVGFGLVSLYPPPLVVRFAKEIGASDALVAKIRQDFFDTLTKIEQQRSRARAAEIVLAAVLADPKGDPRAAAKHVDEAGQARSEVEKLWLALLQRTRDALSAEQRTKLDEQLARTAREGDLAQGACRRAWGMAAPWAAGRMGGRGAGGPPWLDAPGDDEPADTPWGPPGPGMRWGPGQGRGPMPFPQSYPGGPGMQSGPGPGESPSWF